MDQQQAVLQNILTRRSVRKYQKKPIPHDVLEKILEAGFWAPSASNRQTWHFTVMTNKDTIDKWNEAGKQWMAHCGRESQQRIGRDPERHVFFHAPCVLLVSYKKDPKLAQQLGRGGYGPGRRKHHASRSCHGVGQLLYWMVYAMAEKRGGRRAASGCAAARALPAVSFHYVRVSRAGRACSQTHWGLYRLFG